MHPPQNDTPAFGLILTLLAVALVGLVSLRQPPGGRITPYTPGSSAQTTWVYRGDPSLSADEPGEFVAGTLLILGVRPFDIEGRERVAVVRVTHATPFCVDVKHHTGRVARCVPYTDILAWPYRVATPPRNEPAVLDVASHYGGFLELAQAAEHGTVATEWASGR